jgi:hypothetical protein
MQASLKEHILRLPHSAWRTYREDREAVSECADVLNYWPEAEDDKEWGPLAVRSSRFHRPPIAALISISTPPKPAPRTPAR